MTELDELRKEIDKIDRELLPLFVDRMEVCKKVSDYKRKVGKPVLDIKRENQVLENKMALLEEMGLGGLDNEDLKNEVYEFFSSIMTISKVKQNLLLVDNSNVGETEKNIDFVENPQIGYFGNIGSYTYLAARKYFGENFEGNSYKTFEDVFLGLKEGKVDFGVLPIENSSTGTIVDVIDLLDKYQYHIVGEVYLPIKHSLIGVKGSKIEDVDTIYSHSQGILQCRDFVKSLGKIKCETCLSTSAACEIVSNSNDVNKAAIGNKECAKLYNLEILKENINTISLNTTRFVIIGKMASSSLNRDKISATFKLPHESGALSRILTTFAVGGLSLMKLESRPIPECPFEYRFFIDFSGNLNDEKVRAVVEIGEALADDFRILGNYKMANLDENMGV